MFFFDPAATDAPAPATNQSILVGDDAVALHVAQRRDFCTTDIAHDAASRCGGSAHDTAAWERFEMAAAASPFGAASPPAALPRSTEAVARARVRAMAVRYDPSGRMLAMGLQHPGVIVAAAEGFAKGLQVLAQDHGRHLGWALLDVSWHRTGGYMVRCGWSSSVVVLRPSEDGHLTGPWQSHSLDAHRLANNSRMGIFSCALMGDTVVAGTTGGMVFAADLETEQVRACSYDHSLDCNAVCAVSEASGVYASGGDDGVIMVTDLRAQRSSACFGHSHGITSLDARGDDRYICSNSKDQTIKVFDLRMATHEVAEVRAARQQAHLALGVNDYRAGPPLHVTYVNTRSDNSCLTLSGHQVYYTLLRARFSPLDSTGGRFIACGSIDGRIAIFDIVTQEVSFAGDTRYTEIVRDVAWHPDGTRIAAACSDGCVRVLGPTLNDHDADARVYSRTQPITPRPGAVVRDADGTDGDTDDTDDVRDVDTDDDE
uniref:Guanine nucleotide-binding protein subunit beta-like protein n=1 Tax=Neobodo designis TaxID=312471 RepID=A0A7S1MPT4_NEODS|mmetsp:Transcript_44879/g.138454  ORF Transcript_44879/g.138454 Transcript_44879/m.138454 type:complete len:487 (+) Transcript_44879:94-1554(+)